MLFRSEIADAPPGAVTAAVDLTTNPKPDVVAPKKADGPTVKVNIASIGQDGKAKFEDAKNLEDFGKMK